MLKFLSVLTATAVLSAWAPAMAASKLADNPANWPSYGRTASEQHYSPLKDVNLQNVGQLGLAWSFDLEEFRAVEGTPLVIDGVLYAVEAWSKVHAIDAKTGKQIWRFDPEVPHASEGKACCGPVARGLASYNGKIFVATFDGRLIGLDAKTGKKLWEQQTVDDPSWPYSITGAPRVAKGKVIIGNAGADLGVRGYVTAYDADTGKRAWRFYTVPGDPKKGFENETMEMAAKTWTGEWWKYGGGGSVWDSMSYDADLDLLYIGVGNGSPWNQKIRSPGGGDNLFLASIVALKPDTGKYVWHYQTAPGETWDYTATQAMILADMTIDGKKRKVLMQAPKNGFFYVLDRVTGKLISAQKHMPANWAERIDLTTGRPVASADARYPDGKSSFVSPPGDGGVDGWQPPAFDPTKNTVYFRSISAGQFWQDDPTYKFTQGYLNGGVVRAPGKIDPAQAGSMPAEGYYLLAWDPIAQKQVWRSPQRGRRNGGLLATAGGLLFASDANDIVAYDAGTGKEVWTFNVHNHALAAPVAFQVNGEQYIALVVGQGFATIQPGIVPNAAEMPNTNRVLAFKLGAKGALPMDTFPEVKKLPPPPARVGTPEMIKVGSGIYDRHCFFCHGGAARGDKTHPDLRFSDVLGDKDAWKGVLIDGARAEMGMKSFSGVLTPETAEAIRAFVINQAQEAAAAAAPQSGPAFNH